MAVQTLNSQSWGVVLVAALMASSLGGCDRGPGEEAKAPASGGETKAPGVISGTEQLPPGHPPLEGLQAPAPLGGNMPADHPPLPGAADGAQPRPADEPDHPPSSGKELDVSIPDGVEGKWSAVKLEVTMPDGGKQEIRAVLGEETQLADSGLTLRAEIFLPSYISDFKTITSASNDLVNPAVKVRLMESQKDVAVGWLFQNLPEFNSFESDRVELRLLSAEGAETAGDSR
ncbi:MAG TPA: hypothetical protein ENI99_10640 [Sedimenticola sp.]|nr:hypothetical protein [Sedimenticola sp.]